MITEVIRVRNTAISDGHVWIRFRIYKTKSGFVRWHKRSFGRKSGPDVFGTTAVWDAGDGEMCIDVVLFDGSVGSGKVAHELMHAAFYAYRILKGIERITIPMQHSSAAGDLDDSNDIEEQLCYLLQKITTSFWEWWLNSRESKGDKQ